jgi:hypothetical protein
MEPERKGFPAGGESASLGNMRADRGRMLCDDDDYDVERPPMIAAVTAVRKKRGDRRA